MKRIVLLLVAVGFVIQMGCSTVHQVEIKMPNDGQAIWVRPADPVAMVRKLHHEYSVQKGDCLWGIAGKVYQDPFQWPIIFKANRDTIKNPDLIYTSQVLVIEKNGDVAQARDLASKTPKFRSHAAPRKALPVNYF